MPYSRLNYYWWCILFRTNQVRATGFLSSSYFS